MRRVWCSFVISLFLLNVAMVGYYLFKKDGFHVDELLSYAHANSTQEAYLGKKIDSYFIDVDDEIHGKWLDNKVFRDYLTTQDNERFRYGHIFHNLKVVEHPPFYYILLHTICSFMPNVFSKWQAGGLNLVIFFLVLIMLFKLSKLFFDDELFAILPPILYGFSMAGISVAVFLRMYMLQTLFAVCLFYETGKMVRDNSADKKRLGLIGIYSSLGILTQYSSLFLSFFLAAATCMVLFCRKNWELLWRYAIIMLLSAVVLFAVFPTAFDVLFYSRQGQGSLSRLEQISEIFNHSEAMFFRFRHVWGQFLVFKPISELFVVINVLGFLVLVLGKKNPIYIWVSLAVCFFMILFVLLFMPNMFEFDLRYFAVLLPVWAVLLVYCFVRFWKLLDFPKELIFVLCALFVAANSVKADFGHMSPFSFQNNEADKRFFEDIKGKKIILRDGWKLGIYENSLGFMNVEKVWARQDECDVSLIEEVKKTSDAVVVYHHLHRGRKCMKCYPLKPREICPELLQYLKFKYSVRIGETFYDIYDVKS